MPKAAPKLPDGFIADNEGTHVYCQICCSNKGRTWLRIGSVRNHVKGKDHLKNIERENENQRRVLENTRLGNIEKAHHGELNSLDIEDLLNVENLNPFYADIDWVQDHEMFYDKNGDSMRFSVGDPFAKEKQDIKLQEEMLRFQHYGYADADEDSDDIGLTNIAALYKAAGGGNNEDEDFVPSYSFTSKDEEWFPYPSKTMFLLDMLDSLPRLRLSDTQFRVILSVMKECGAKDIPPLSALRRLQKKLRKSAGVPLKQTVSSRGNIFYSNDIASQIAEDFANPLVRPFLKFYPEDTELELNETWNGEKWCSGLSSSDVTPMAIGENREHFYINELTLCKNKTYIFPQRWIYKKGVLCGASYLVHQTDDAEFLIIRDELHFIPVTDMQFSFLSLMSMARNPNMFVTTDGACLEVNPLRTKAAGRAFYAVQLKVWADDVSGNRSKQWNKHLLWCMTHVGLPKKLLFQEYFIRFICCSQHASALEQAAAVCEMISATREGIVAHDAETHEEVMFFINMFQLSGDNPMLSELCSHTGLTANYLCYRCEVGGTKEYKITAKGYDELYHPGKLRNAASTYIESKKQLEDGVRGNNVEDRHRTTGVKDMCGIYWIEEAQKCLLGLEDPALRLQMETNILNKSDTINPLLNVNGFDPHADGPVEPLHTVLLGVVKYCWALTCEQIISKNHVKTFQARLDSVDTTGMNMSAIRAGYLIQYRGALIGRQFKVLMQVMPFVLHGLVDDKLRTLWRMLGELGAFLWMPLIKDKEVYLRKLAVIINNFLDALANVDPSKIVTKPKCHILTHILQDIQRFGPAVLLSTEMFECFNGVWRLCSILSNHHAPSRDIANNLADIDRFKHLASGGFWKEGDSWVQAGKKARLFLQNNPELQGSLGWVIGTKHEPGDVCCLSAKKSFPVEWRNSTASTAIPYFSEEPIRDETLFDKCSQVIAANGDVVKPSNFVVAQKSTEQDVIVGEVEEILSERGISGNKVIVTIKRFTIGAKHSVLNMPTIHRREEDILVRVEAEHVQFLVNTQHDCERAGCRPMPKQMECQERTTTSRTVNIIEHNDNEHFIVNVQALHNVNLVRAVFPDIYYDIPPVTEDRNNFHNSNAEILRKKAGLQKATTKARRDALKVLNVTNKR